MKKLLVGLLALIFIILVGGYTLLFTGLGNNVVASYIEKKINNTQSKVKIKIDNFVLTSSEIDFEALIDDDSKVKIKGDLNLFFKNANLIYDVNIKDLSFLEKIINKKIRGPLFTKGIIKGDSNIALIKGESNVAHSKTLYDIELKKFELSSVNLISNKLKISELLHMAYLPEIMDGEINIDTFVKDAKIGSMEGGSIITLENGKILSKVVNKKYKQNLKKDIELAGKIKANFDKDKIFIDTKIFNKMLEVISEKTLIDLSTNKITGSYFANVKDLSMYSGIMGLDLRGSCWEKGEFTLENNDVKVVGNSNIFNSNTTFDMGMKDFIVNKLNLNVKDADISDVLYTFNKRPMAKGDINVDVKITSIKPKKLKGDIQVVVENGKINNNLINKRFNTKLKDKINFSSNITTTLKDESIISNAFVKSNLANIFTKKAIFNLKDSSLTSDYKIEIDSLEKFTRNLSSVKARGEFNLDGDILLSKDIKINGVSNLFDGKFKFNLINDNLTAKIENSQIKELMYMLYYPKIFDSLANLDIEYNLKDKKGELVGKLVNGHFLENDFSILINQLAKFDLTKEVYKETDISSKINKNIILSNIDMKSKNTLISMEKTKFDTDKNTIDGLVKTKIKKMNFGIKVKGNINEPKFSIDSKDILKNEAKKQIEKNENEIKRGIKKIFKNNSDDENEKLLEGIKSLFE